LFDLLVLKAFLVSFPLLVIVTIMGLFMVILPRLCCSLELATRFVACAVSCATKMYRYKFVGQIKRHNENGCGYNSANLTS